MPLDAVVLSALRDELTGPLTGARIDRISMPERDLLILSVHSRQEGNRRLLLSLRPGSARVHFTNEVFENPAQPPMFCMLLRKHIAGARIAAVEQPPYERVLLLRMEGQDELGVTARPTLAVELMGKGLNLVLVGEDGRILDCLRRVDYESGARRALLPGLFYSLPPGQPKPGFFSLTPDQRRELLRQAGEDGDPVRWLLDTFGGLSPLLCRELALEGWAGLEAAMEALAARVEARELVPVMLLEQGAPKDFSFMPLRQYGEAATQEIRPSFSQLLDEFYARRDRAESLRRRGAELARTAHTARERLLRKLAAREQELRATEDRELYRLRGELITANIYRLHRGMESFQAQDYYQDGCPEVTIPLDGRKTPQQNAALNFRRYAKAKTAASVLTGLIADCREEIAYLDSVLDELSRAEGDRDLGEIRRELVQGGYLREKPGGKRPRQAAPRRPLRFLSSAGREILVGRGNVQNDELTFHVARRTDLWLHVQKVPGSHVIVSQAEGPADRETVLEAASLAVTYSQARDGGKAAVDYTQVRNVKKPAGARPGRVIYTDYATVITQGDETLARRLSRE